MTRGVRRGEMERRLNITASRKDLDSKTLTEDLGVDAMASRVLVSGVPQISSSRRVTTHQAFGYVLAEMPSSFTPEQLVVVESEYVKYMRYHDPSEPADKNQVRRITILCYAVGPMVSISSFLCLDRLGLGEGYFGG